MDQPIWMDVFLFEGDLLYGFDPTPPCGWIFLLCFPKNPRLDPTQMEGFE